MKFCFNKIVPIITLFMICSPVHADEEFVLFSSLRVMDSPLWISPIRNIGEDGSIVAMYSKKPTAIPYFYPKLVNVIDFIDFGKKFYTLEQLSANPKLGPTPTYRQIENKFFDDSIDVKQDKKVLSLENRLRELEQKLLEKETKEMHRPNDEELKAFIQEGNEHLNPEERIMYLNRLISDENTDTPEADSLAEKTEKIYEPTYPPAPALKEIPSYPAFNDEAGFMDTAYHREVKKSVLRFKASVPTRQGVARPAQASEFYLTTKNLQDLFGDLELDRALAGEVKSVAELWAHAEKDSSSNPDIALGVKSILLQAKVGKARTDPFGKAELNDVSPDDKYYLIGIDKDDQTGVVTIWSKHIEVEPGENMVELTTNDVIYQD